MFMNIFAGWTKRMATEIRRVNSRWIFLNVSIFQEIIMEMYILIAGIVGVALWYFITNTGRPS